MFGWVPSEGWVFIGLVFIIYFSKESIKLFLSKGKNKLYVIPFILFIISGIALVLLEGRHIFRFDIMNLKHIDYIFNLYEVSLISALISSFYLSYKEAKDNKDYNKINKIRKNMKPILYFFLILIFLRIIIIFFDN
jgi:succinate dehydrogenase hydrophobic anchor subunit